MATNTHTVFGPLTVALSTQLDAAVNNNTPVLGPAQDNSAAPTGLQILADFTIVMPVQAANRTAGAKVELYIAYSRDGGVTYDTMLAGFKQPAGTFSLDSGVLTAVQTTITDIPLPPGFWKAYARNLTGQTFAATLNTIKYQTHSVLSAA